MGKIIRDPIHNIIEVDRDALALIDTEVFQRLRRIRQLGVAWLVYPAAEHSRFTHSVGTYNMSKCILNNLEKNSVGFQLDKDKKKLVILAGLLHDIGHAPFSHAFETAIKNLKGDFKHEHMSTKIIMECNEISSKLKKHGKNFPEEICQIIDNKYSDPYVASIVSSQFDADRIDYLLRDSYMTGANYGRFDIDWLLKNIRIEKSTFRHSEGEMVVSIDYKKGLNVLEQYLIGRYFMYTHVYYHRVNRGFEIVVTNIIKRILEKKYDNFMGYNYINDLHSGNISLEDYLKLDDFTVLTWFKDWYEKTQDFILKDLLYHLFTRKPYYEVIYPPYGHMEYSEEKEKIMNGFENEDEKEYYFQEDSPKNTAYRDLYNMDEMLEEIYISKNGDVIPLSAIEDSIITGAKGVLKKEKILWYKKRERGNEANGYE
ncbi:MAG: HD domain-containing protein [Natronincolaceae bacterium]|jgi:HD superfamily phosphohydrolase|nr:HD domain-containing protein [Bacillota bacterium]